ncbi:ATP-dependent DNA ligase [Saccharothrix sp. ALI-22-I]|uniref:ATP-dependent DNA ligase n=1 Tax=Saccharothrix sp. ALI-22-I TaxID=1933778 RepID=UPI00097C6FB5|nr:ATP-dependent DNA ligase [Saccharothrix sp. ALI-22-I]ONI86334.1 ATP-dependent DNA ligase [Saccharothrix sp. ALI-22-I]
MLFTEVVETSAAVTATRSRLAKVAALAELVRRMSTPAVVSFLVGVPSQGRIGAGWRTVFDLAVPPAPQPSLTVSEVDEALGAFASAGGRGSTARRAALLTDLFGRATAAEQDFLRRLLTGELRQGALEGVMLDAIARAADVPGEVVRRAFMLSGKLPETAVAAMTGEDALARFRLEVGRPVRPMLASPAESLNEALAELGSCVVEHKLDGARIQVHRSGDEIRIFTRTLREITATVPELVELVRGLPCTSVVLDGETLALNDDGKPRPFQETMSRFGALLDAASAGKRTSAGDVRELLLSPFFFDCLHLDGVDLLDEPLRARLDALRAVAGRHVIPGVVAPSEDDAAQVLDEALAAGHEGVMVKSLDSVYAAGRRGRAWQKVKPVHTLDLVVLGVEWGSGRRKGLLSNLHLGARDPDGGPPIMVGKTFKGLTDELLAWQTRELMAIATEKTDWAVMVRPELVIEIELDGAQVSPRYPGGVALRFARVLRYRPDKDAGEADTIDAVRALLPKRGAGQEDTTG